MDGEYNAYGIAVDFQEGLQRSTTFVPFRPWSNSPHRTRPQEGTRSPGIEGSDRRLAFSLEGAAQS